MDFILLLIIASFIIFTLWVIVKINDRLHNKEEEI